jgi:peptidoglycan/xylan/chitin deacetylase (PgdA/CDA1 family)
MNPVRIPVLMYHEIINGSSDLSHNSSMGPISILDSTFENQIHMLAELGYRSILFEDVNNLDPFEKCIIITFDDGWKGNVENALPILKKYGFNAIFFIAVGSIGMHRFMSWDDVNILYNSGMDIQSHTMRHTPLETIRDENQLFYELLNSKEMIESTLHKKVSAISFPHGSYNQHIIELAGQTGYEIMCTSDIERVFNTSFMKKPVLLGRIPIASSLNTDRFIKYIQYDNLEILKLKLNKHIKKMFKKLIGINLYRYLYRTYFRINAQ